MKKDRRWLKSVIAASAGPLPALPFARDMRRMPAALKPGTAPQKAAAAAR